MINKLTPFKGLNIRIPIIIPIKGRGFTNHGSGLGGLNPLPPMLKLPTSNVKSSHCGIF